MHKKDILKIKAIRSKHIYDWTASKKARNSVKNEVKLQKKTHYMNVSHKCDN